ncbi:hypothetical protein GQ54DRAFT_295058 [Martensiomyces pterosporus]|nr:hypothetical protein GQ54DRAFT_295058 [Martensiomyces pterosporus]
MAHEAGNRSSKAAGAPPACLAAIFQLGGLASDCDGFAAPQHRHHGRVQPGRWFLYRLFSPCSSAALISTDRPCYFLLAFISLISPQSFAHLAASAPRILP